MYETQHRWWLVWKMGELLNKTQFRFFEISFGTDYITLLCTANLSHHRVTFCTPHAGEQHRAINRLGEFGFVN